MASGSQNMTSYKVKTIASQYTSSGGQQPPNYFGTNTSGILMMNTTVNGNSQYKDWLLMDAYSGTDVGGGVAIGVNRQSLGAYIMRSAAARATWAESAELLGTHNWRKFIFGNKNWNRSQLTISDSSWAVTSGIDVFGLSFKDSGLTYTPSGGSATTATDTGDWRAWLTCASTSNTVELNMRIDGSWQAGKFIGPLQGNADTATKATQDGSGNVITSKYVTVDTAQTITGTKSWGTSGAGGQLNGAATDGGVNSIRVGNDVWLGDCNQGGIMGMKSTGANTGLYFYNSSGTNTGQFYTNGTNFICNKPISRAGVSKSWINGRDTAIIRTTSYNGYDAITSMKTTDGAWEMGVYTDNIMYFVYTPDAKYNSGTNNGYTSINIQPNGHLYAAGLHGPLTGDVTGSCSGSAAKWATARTITLTGSVTGSVSIDGSENVSLATTTNHNHDWRYPQNHITSFAFTGNNRPLSRYVTFDLNAPAGGPGGWINGFMSVHNDYLASYIVQEHRTDNWYLGWNQYSTGDSTISTAPVWRKIIHSGNIGSQSVATATTASYLSPPNVAAYTTDGDGNFTHKRNTTGDYWHLNKNDGGATFSVYWEKGNVTAAGTVTAAAFSGPLTGNVTGNCSGSSGSCTGNAATATSAGKWTTARTLTIGNKGQSVDGSGNVSWALQDILIRSSNEFDFVADAGISAIHFNHKSQSGRNTTTATTAYYFKNGQGATTGVTIYAAAFNGNLTGNVTGNCSGSSGSCTGNAATATKLGTANKGSANHPIYLSGGTPTECAYPKSGAWWTAVPFIHSDGMMEIGRYIDFHGTSNMTGDHTIRFTCATNTARIDCNGIFAATGWSDLAEYRHTIEHEPGRAVIPTDCGIAKRATKRLQPGARIVSDTYGFCLGESDDEQSPIALTGRVLAYPCRPISEYHAGDAVCSGPNGTVDLMIREEIQKYPDCIIGIVNEIPTYPIWNPKHTDDRQKVVFNENVEVRGRIWIDVK